MAQPSDQPDPEPPSAAPCHFDKLNGVPELMEQILLHLPLPNLLLTQRVCKFWHQIVHDSPGTSQALFLKPYKKGSITYDTILEQEGSDRFRKIQNPFLNKFVDISGALEHTGFINPTDKALRNRPVGLATKRFNYPKASWRAMQVFQPLVQSIDSLQCTEIEEIEDEGIIDGLQDIGGVRMGAMVQALRDHWMVCPNCPVWPDRNPETCGLPPSWDWSNDCVMVDVKCTGHEVLEWMATVVKKGAREVCNIGRWSEEPEPPVYLPAAASKERGFATFHMSDDEEVQALRRR